MRKTDLYLLEHIQTEMSQSQIIPQMIQYTVFYDALGHKAAHRAASVCCAVHPCCKVRICLEYDEHLVGNGHVAVFTPLALEDEQLLAVKADVVPSEAACLADPEGAVVDDGKQGFVVQGAVAEKAGNLLLGEHSEKQHCLSNFQAIVIDTAVCILCQTQFLSKKRNAVPEFRYSRDRLVQCSIGHFLCGGEKRKISVKYCRGRL